MLHNYSIIAQTKQKKVIVFNGKTHITLGVAIAIYFLDYTNMQNTEIILLLGGLIPGLLLPDADHKKSIIGCFVPLWLIIKHRTFTHSIMFIVICSFSVFINPFIGLGLTLGVAIHIIIDLLTVSGCPLFYPFKRSRFNLLNFKTGGKVELVLNGMSVLYVAKTILL